MKTDEEANMYLNQFHSELKDNEISHKSLSLRIVSSALKEGGVWDIFTSRTNADYGYQIAISYFASFIKTRRLYSGAWSDWDAYVRTSDLDIKQTTISEGLFYHKYGKVVLVTLNKEITLQTGWNTLSSGVPKADGSFFNTCNTVSLSVTGMLHVSGTVLQVSFPNTSIGDTIVVRGSIVYMAEA